MPVKLAGFDLKTARIERHDLTERMTEIDNAHGDRLSKDGRENIGKEQNEIMIKNLPRRHEGTKNCK
jgi:hypothetical protein